MVASWLIYLPGLGGSFYFDDNHNLEGLSEVSNFGSALHFAFTGTAGPTGRPIALATFGAQAYAWPHHPEVFLHVNILIHALNGALLVWLFILVSRLRGLPQKEAAWLGLLAAALWLSIPLLASSSLFIVQRMTTLATTFMLGGMIGYLIARNQITARPKSALLGMSVALSLGTLLATLTKENGALLPLLILVMEVTLPRRSLFSVGLAARLWGFFFLFLPLLILLSYLAHGASYTETIELRRGFTAEQRLWTQAQILWGYLFNAFIPTPHGLVPFSDHVAVAQSLLRPTVLLAIAAWIGIIGLALWLRQRAPLFALAVFWYLGAHLLESTVLSLELVFQHRNYVALIGPAYALVASVWMVRGPGLVWARALLVTYILVLNGSALNVTSLWGQPALAAEMWAIHKPESVRVQQGLASHLQKDQFHHAALRVLDETHLAEPTRRAPVGVQALLLACAIDPEADHIDRVRSLAEQLPHAKFYHGVPKVLMELRSLVNKEPCEGVDSEQIGGLARALLRNSRYSSESVSRHDLHALLGQIAFDNRDFHETMTHFEYALRSVSSLEGLGMVLRLLIDAGRSDLGDEFIEIVRAQVPSHPIRRTIWLRQLDSFDQELRAIRMEDAT